jgi:hypothetical protein
MLVVVIVACLAVGLLQAGIALVSREGVRPRWLTGSRRAGGAVAAVAIAGLAAAIIALVATGADHHLWQQFKRPNAPASTNQYFRLFSIAGSHRYQYWQAALSAFDPHALKGIGPGTFEFYWAEHNSLAEFVRNAHSLYIETLAELGIVGLTLIGGFVALVLVGGSTRALRAPAPTRLAIATAVAGFAAFAAGAAFDWVWQIGVVPFLGVLLAAGALVAMRTAEPIGPAHRRLRTRLVLAAATVVGLWAIFVPLAATLAVRSSQAAVRSGDTRSALRDAADAQRLEPLAATPRLQRALILEQLGDIGGAVRAVRDARNREPTNWRIWLVASRIEAEANQPRAALADYRRARVLNPTSPIFQR